MVHVLFVAERSSADLARERLQSLVNRLGVLVEVSCLSKLLPTLIALVWLEFLMDLLDVLAELSLLSKRLPTLIALVWLEFLVDLSDVHVKIVF